MAISNVLTPSYTFHYFLGSPNQILLVNVTSIPSGFIKPYNLTNGILLISNFTPTNISSNVTYKLVNSSAILVPLYDLQMNSSARINFSSTSFNISVYLSTSVENREINISYPSSVDRTATNHRYFLFVIFALVLLILSILFGRRKRH
ncbi:hypothetical protein [Metallosphaera hakonensis]|uniref:hypothetical protein n=1 Tax=Metallosphaera hakonensis TaxID=79601 RepID=UPI00197CA296|nr:hypothetical protein [Metallosphaera hakonensis]